jgi:hypothetical protein
MESWLHSFPSGQPQLALGRCLEKIESVSIKVFCSLYIEVSRHLFFIEFDTEFFRA